MCIALPDLNKLNDKPGKPFILAVFFYIIRTVLSQFPARIILICPGLLIMSRAGYKIYQDQRAPTFEFFLEELKSYCMIDPDR